MKNPVLWLGATLFLGAACSAADIDIGPANSSSGHAAMSEDSLDAVLVRNDVTWGNQVAQRVLPLDRIRHSETQLSSCTSAGHYARRLASKCTTAGDFAALELAARRQPWGASCWSTAG